MDKAQKPINSKDSLLYSQECAGLITLFYITERCSKGGSTPASSDWLLSCRWPSPAFSMRRHGNKSAKTIEDSSKKISFRIQWITLAPVPPWAECLALLYGGSRPICNRVASQNEITLWTPPMFLHDNSVIFSKTVEITVTDLQSARLKYVQQSKPVARIIKVFLS